MVAVAAPVEPAIRRVAIAGNPNCGKSTIFNALTGLRQKVGNYPGVTVETKKGRMTWQGRFFDLIDLPGTYSLAPRSPDEMVAVDVILGQQKGEVITVTPGYLQMVGAMEAAGITVVKSPAEMGAAIAGRLKK